jgi:hypothetical protein
MVAAPREVPAMSDPILPFVAAPDDSSVASIDDAQNPFVRAGTEHWQSLKADRSFPARAELTLRGMAPFLPYSVIVAVIGRGEDFEYRYVGDAQRQAFKTYFKGLRVSQIESVAPALGSLLRGVYEQVRLTGTPFLVRGRLGLEPPDDRFQFHETAFLPLGNGEAVDHILVVGVQVPRPFWQYSQATLQNLTEQLGTVFLPV